MNENINTTEQNEQETILTPLQAVRRKCLDCSGGSSKDVRTCKFTDCTLYPYRMGKDPYRAGFTNKGSFKTNTSG